MTEPDPSTEPLVSFLREDRIVLSEAESKALLGRFDIPVVAERVVDSGEGALEAAAAIGYPVVVKGDAPGLRHKSDHGLVHLDIDSPDALTRAVSTVQASLDEHVPSHDQHVLVQPMLAGAEIMLGMQYDEQFGPMVAVGPGGIFVELLDDVVLRRPPIDRAMADAMVRETRAIDLLQGARSTSRYDIEALLELVERFGEFCRDTDPLLATVDLNPVVVRASGAGAVAVDAMIELRRGTEVEDS